jgi:hypothetical protein
MDKSETWDLNQSFYLEWRGSARNDILVVIESGREGKHVFDGQKPSLFFNSGPSSTLPQPNAASMRIWARRWQPGYSMFPVIGSPLMYDALSRLFLPRWEPI